MKLNKSTVEGCALPEKGYTTIWDDALRGFGLRVTAAGARSYIVQARVNGNTRRSTIGRHGLVTAEQARKEARQLLADMARGVDPVAQQKADEAARKTLRDVVDDYVANKRRKDGKPLAERTKTDIRRHLSTTFADWADKPIDKITEKAVRRRYLDLGKRGQAQANQSMRVLSALFVYAIRSPEYTTTKNPVGVIEHVRFADNARVSRVPKDQRGAFYSALEQLRTSPTSSPSLRTKAAAAVVLMQTGLRFSDVVKRTWDDVDLQAGTLHVEDTKHRTPRTFPLARQVVDVLREQRALSAGEYVFQSDGGKGPVHDLRDALKRAGEAIDHDVAAHDLRRTYDDVFVGCDVDPFVGEMLSNRKPNISPVRARHYAQTWDLTDDKFRSAAQAIADRLDSERRVHDADNVVTIGARA